MDDEAKISEPTSPSPRLTDDEWSQRAAEVAMAGAEGDEEARQARVDETARILLAARVADLAATQGKLTATPLAAAFVVYVEADKLERARGEYIAKRRAYRREVL